MGEAEGSHENPELSIQDSGLSTQHSELGFEAAFERLQATIQKLEEGGLTLEASIEQFELGMRLANLCSSMLDQAEMRVSRLLAGEEEPRENGFLGSTG